MSPRMEKKWIVFAAVAIAVGLLIATQLSSPTYEAPDKPRVVLGTPDAAVRIVEYGDLQCPACRAAHGVVKNILEEYGDVVSYEFRHFPLEAIHPRAFVTAQAAECAHDQDSYYDFIDRVFAHQQDLSKNRLRVTADSLGLNTELFDACVDSGAKRAIVRQQQQEGRNLRVSSTPTFFVNGEVLQSWELSSFRATLDALTS